MNLINEFDNKLLHRKEVVISLTKEKTPSKIEITEEIAKNFKSSGENIIIEKISGKFGKKEFTIHAKIYNDTQSKEKYETITRKEKKKIREESKKAEEEKKKAQENTKKEELKQEEAVE
ncbi:hypothetical protein J4477_02390 [Candidatus Pacearchaeota archaeon]|nr:hypothetical protein [Candidatus Pacearchaeota archaeon]